MCTTSFLFNACVPHDHHKFVDPLVSKGCPDIEDEALQRFGLERYASCKSEVMLGHAERYGCRQQHLDAFLLQELMGSLSHVKRRYCIHTHGVVGAVLFSRAYDEYGNICVFENCLCFLPAHL